jgi:hypothetical protein
MKLNSIVSFALLFSLSGPSAVRASIDPRAPEVPSTLELDGDYKVCFHVYAVGLQIYTAIPSTTDPTKLVWTLKGPQAVLFDDDGNVVGSHYAYAGPTRPAWQSESGSLVVAARAVPPVTVDPDAIAWLRLDAVYAEGPGIFDRVERIQRVNTTGGLAPATPPAQLGDETCVPYTAEYFFYRAAK